ncbi:O-antigen ligase family protein [Proteiniclasticum sp. C24MP]|uniref:O-antigen ligase family protein n=1 Tax=Proteiniclasticum sp. C24MP TaxID=3374101 RepID=UPI003754CE0F
MNNQIEIQKNSRRNQFIIWFVLLQPLVDILTSLGIIYFKMSVTVGVVARSLFLCLIMWDLIITPHWKKRKAAVFYVVILALYCISFLGLIIITPDNGTIFTNIKQLFKIVYFPLTLVYFYQMYKEGRIIIRKELLSKVLFIYMFIIFLGFISGTGFSAYSTRVSGNKGWFFAGNDLTAILSLLIPLGFHVTVTQFIDSRSLTKRLFILFYFFLIVFSTTHIGTKAIYFSTLVFFFIYGVYHGIKFLSQKKVFQIGVSTTSLILVALMLVSMKFTPIGESFNVLQFKFEQSTEETPPVVVEDPIEEVIDKDDFTDAENEEMEEVTESSTYRVANWLLSNRLDKALPVHIHYMDQSAAAKMLGIGYFRETGKIDLSTQIEIDFLALFYRHGFLGMLIILLPMGYIILNELTRAFKHWRKVIGSPEILVLLLSVMYMLAFALITGHVLVSPAVSIFVSMIIVSWVESQDRSFHSKSSELNYSAYRR